ncbi:MAG: chemotaxis protein CheB [Devosiaceae bacterium]
MVSDKNDKDSLFWVGLGASAGGLEALRAFVRSVPRNLHATYIIAQHLSPHHRSMLPEILGRETDFEVLSVEDSVFPQPDTIYITPQNKDIQIDGDQLRLVSPGQDAGAPKPSVDRFFHSLANEKGERAIGIILSGTGSDGARGVRDVRAAGGVTIAQDEMSAKYTGMPVAAVESGCVDLVMSPEEIGAQFATILEHRADLESLKASPVHLDGVSELIHLVNNQTRVNFHHYKSATLQRRIERRMAAVGVTNIDDYVAIARTTPNEVDALFRDFLISVTSFFRDPGEFEALRRYVDQVVNNKPKNETIRVWVPAVATGEEVYSIAMMITDALGGTSALSERRIQIFATDIDTPAIELARRGFYPDSALQEVPRHYIDAYMDRLPTGYMVKKAIRERVVFSVHNVVQDPPFLNIDILSCRNLLIYFQTSLQAQAFSRFHYALVPHGLLFLGKSETTAANGALFKQADDHRHIYFQQPGAERASVAGLHAPQYQVKRGADKREMVDVRDVTTMTTRFDSLVRAFGPDGLLIDEDLQIMKAYGNVNPYIEMSSGAVSLRAGSLLKEPFGQDIRTAIPIVMRKGEPRKCMAHPHPADPKLLARLSVYPVESGPNERPLAIALFSTWEEKLPTFPIEDASHDLSELYRQNEELRQELSIAQNNLQQTSEELETSNEELQALNEELQSSNEELQSTNEELETSNEELQSTNEELSTVNEELQVTSQEVTVANQSIHSILLNIGSPLIAVDTRLDILHISNATEKLFNLTPGHEISHLSLLARPDGFPDIIELANSAMSSSKRIDMQIESNGLHAIVSVVPNIDDTGNVEGAIILIHDNSAELRLRNNQMLLAEELSGVGYWNMDLIESTVFWSEQIYAIHGVEPHSYQPNFETAIAFYHPDDLVAVQQDVERAVEEGSGFEFEARIIQPGGQLRNIRSIGSATVNDEGKTTSVFGVFVDITEEKARADKLEALLADLYKSNQELNRFSYVCSHDMKEPVRMIEAMCDLILDKDAGIDQTEREEIICRIGTNASRLREIITSLLAYSRIDEKIDESDVDLNATVAQIKDSLALTIEETGTQLTVAKLPTVHAAPVHFVQLLQNLIANAIKFCESAPITIHVSSKTLKDEVKIFVEDNGPGIPLESRDDIFTVFKRLKRSNEVDGSGLGLSICQRIVSQYGGSIGVDTSSKLGGARFIITLPRAMKIK